MSRSRAIAFLTAFAAALAMTFGLTAFGATAAQATPSVGAYPPPPASLVVNKGTVKYGVTVKATGKKFTKKEKVTVVVTFLPKGSKKWKTIKVVGLKADKAGKFTYNVKTFAPGTIRITAKGATSKKVGVASIYVINKKKGKFVMRRASFDTGSDAVAVGNPTEEPANGTWLAIAGLGILVLAGSAAVTRNHVRRRNNV